MNRTKQNERKYLLNFLANTIEDGKINPIDFTEIIQVPKDPPDYVIKNEDKTISIEITVLNVDNGLTRKQFSLDNVVKKVIRKIDTELPERYDLKLGETLEWKVLDINENKLANQIFKIIKHFNKITKFEHDYEFITDVKQINKNRYMIDFMCESGNKLVLLCSKIKGSHSTGDAAFATLGYLNYFDIAFAVINKKENNLIKYNKKYDKNYLLLVCDPNLIKGCKFKFDQNFYNHRFQTDFDKIFLMEIDWTNEYKITELKT